MKTILTILALICICSETASAQWTPCNGTFGGFVNNLAVIDTTIFAGTQDGGIYTSSDKGESWKEMYSVLNGSYITILKAMDTVLFAVTYKEAFRSMDKGHTWVRLDSVLNRIQDFVISGSKIYARIEPALSIDPIMIYCSSDKGDTWFEIKTKLPLQSNMKIVTVDSLLFISNYGKGLYRSTDNGNNWSEINKGLNKNSNYFLSVCGTSLFVSCDRAEIYRSTDNGDNWTKVKAAGLPVTDYGVYDIWTTKTKVFARNNQGPLFTSQDYGETWYRINSSPDSLSGLSAFPDSFTEVDSLLFAGTFFGVYRSKTGEKWERVNYGLTAYTAISFAKNPAGLFSGVSDLGLFKSTDNGSSWFKLKENFDLKNITAITTNSTSIFAGANLGGVYRSEGNGENWIKVDSGFGAEPEITSIATLESTVFSGTKSNLYRSTDNGDHWKKVEEFHNTTVYSLAVSDTVIFVAGGKGIMKSTDKGESWTVSAQWQDIGTTTDLAAFGSTVFAATYYGTKEKNGVYRSKDYGETWTKIRNGSDARTFGSLVFDGNRLFVGTYDGVLFSSNLGESWIEVNSGLTNKIVGSMIISDGRVLAGTYKSGIRKLELNTLAANEPEFLQNNNDYSLVCWPNPATNTLTIDRTSLQFPENLPVHYTLSTLIGGKVMEFDNNEPKFTVPLDGMASGVYSLTAVSGAIRVAVIVTVTE